MNHKGVYIQLCLVFLALLGSRADVLSCARTVNGAYFDLTPLQSNKDYIIENVNSDAGEDTTKYIKLQFNICRYTTIQCRTKFTFANLYSNPGTTSTTTDTDHCIQLSNTTKYDDITYSSVDANKPESGLQILFTNGDLISQEIGTWSPANDSTQTANPTAAYSIAMNFRCDSAVDTVSINSWSYDAANFRYTIEMTSTNACAILSLDQVSQFISDNPIPFCIVGAILGLLVAVLGLKLFLPTLFIVCFVAGFFVAFFIFFAEIVTPESRESTKWILVGFAIVLGIMIGYIAIKANKFGIFIIGALLGTVIALILYNAILFKIKTDPAELVLLITLGVLGLGGGILALVFYKHVIIIATSLIGCYAFVRSLSLVIGGFPNEIQLIKQIQTQDYNFSVHWPFYIYMNVIFLLTLLTIYIQYKIKKRSEATEVDFDAEYFKGAEV